MATATADTSAVCNYHELARLRNKRDLDNGMERGLWFDREAADHAVYFYTNYCRHVKGEWRGRRIALEPWQEHDVIRPLFGWKRLPDGMSIDEAERLSRRQRLEAGVVRRYRTAYLEVGRKNGKSTLAAPAMLYLLVGDLEGGGEVYAAGTKRDQAKMVFEPARDMVKMDRRLSRLLVTHSTCVSCGKLGSKLTPLSADANRMDGLNPHGLSADELHQWPQGLWDVLTSAMGARRQPLCLAITTAGTDKQGICYREREHGRRVLEGVINDDSRFVLICTIGDKDDWQDERNWPKANPNLGVSLKLDYLRSQHAQAKGDPLKENSFKRYHLNVWTEAESRWITSQVWRGCRGFDRIYKALLGIANRDREAMSVAQRVGKVVSKRSDRLTLSDYSDVRRAMEIVLRGRVCWGGLDLSSAEDISSLALVFEPFEDEEDAPYWVLNHYWIPKDTMVAKSRKDGIPYHAWVEHGLITATPGDVIDYAYIKKTINEVAKRYRLSDVAFDNWGAIQLSTALQDDGITMVSFSQSIRGYSGPMKEVRRQINKSGLVHGGNPVTSWMADCVVAKQDVNENIRPVKPDRKLTANRIDGIVAMIMAMSRATSGDGNRESVYESRGLVVI